MQFLAQTNDADAAVAAGILALGFGMLLILAIVGLAIGMVICWLIYSAQARVPREHQQMAPGLAFLLLIPFFNLIWAFFVAIKVPDSFKSYFDAQGRTDVGDCGKGVGLGWAVVNIVNLLTGWIPIIGCFITLAPIVLLILFLVKISGLKGQIPIGGAAVPPPPPAAAPPTA